MYCTISGVRIAAVVTAAENVFAIVRPFVECLVLEDRGWLTVDCCRSNSGPGRRWSPKQRPSRRLAPGLEGTKQSQQMQI